MNDCETLIAGVIFEQGLEETLLKNIPRLRKLDEDGIPFITYNRLITNEEGEDVPIRDYFGENFWCCLVEVYGDYGFTMRTGWIEDKQAFFKMIREVDEWNKSEEGGGGNKRMTEKKTCKNCKHYIPPQQKKEGREGIGYYCTKNHTILKYYHCEEHEYDKNIDG